MSSPAAEASSPLVCSPASPEMEDEEKGPAVGWAGASMIVQKMIEAVEEVASAADYRNAFKKLFCSLARRLKLLAPMFEEMRDGAESVPAETAAALVPLREALESAKVLLRCGCEGSKIYLVR